MHGREAARRLREVAGHVPADREEDGLAPELTVAENLLLRAVRRPELRWGPLLRGRRARSHAEELARRLDIRAPGLDAAAGTLSGGNRQKIVLARELDAEPLFLIAAHPTRGLDVGATANVLGLLRELAGRGTPVILVSTDLDEVLEVAHRILVLRRGRLMEIADPTRQ